ncbi:DinB family protein [Alicyclobacillus curvatus]|nr:DinB family protein [Alicyclobacillus curvatus]
MYTSINTFALDWTQEKMLTQKLLDALTDECLNQPVSIGGRTLGRIAWHMVTDVSIFLRHFGLDVHEVVDVNNVPSSATVIADVFRVMSAEGLKAVTEQWTDDTLQEVQDAFGRELTNGTILGLLVKHTIHHRGQITVLMRQAGLQVPGMYGPSKEEWSLRGQEPPSI